VGRRGSSSFLIMRIRTAATVAPYRDGLLIVPGWADDGGLKHSAIRGIHSHLTHLESRSVYYLISLSSPTI
jgi:hypothetical protein